MMDMTRVEFDGAKRSIVFHGDCTEMRAICHAMCCREWVVAIIAEEYASSEFDAEVVCMLTEKACRAEIKTCLNRQYRLKKREDMSCVYLEDNLCSIYARRPRVCQDFQCTGGWKLSSVRPADAGLRDQKTMKITQENFINRLSEDAIFVLHPLIKIHTVFNLKPKREIVFVKEMVGACGKFNTRESFNCPQLDDARLLMLIEMFNRKESLGQIHQLFCSQSAVNLSRKEFYDIVWLLNKNNIILDSLNFKGMLGVMGGIG